MINQAQAVPWIAQLSARRPANVVAVALAHKLARTAWALVAHGRAYDAKWCSMPPSQRPGQAPFQRAIAG